MEPQRTAVAVFMAVTFAFLAFVLIAVDWAGASGLILLPRQQRDPSCIKCISNSALSQDISVSSSAPGGASVGRRVRY
jgi:hypothetical protein